MTGKENNVNKSTSAEKYTCAHMSLQNIELKDLGTCAGRVSIDHIVKSTEL